MAVEDEDEFLDLTGRPGFWDADGAAAVRAEGERMAARAAAGEFPFDGTWCAFRPEPEWGASTLPANWDLPPPLGPTH
ncbi:hypothetical protein [Streptomyces hydrogenans]|uniref:hypothetical protein n=1 Tax=Streptomyces hydrogenans TaxID=1873719 RepID=UPI00331BD8D0